MNTDTLFPQRIQKFKYSTDITEIWQCDIKTIQLIVVLSESGLHIEVDKSEEI